MNSFDMRPLPEKKLAFSPHLDYGGGVFSDL